MRKRTFFFGAVILIIVVAIPFIINQMYLVDEGYVTVWDGADVLAFYGAILGAIGTVVLGVVAWKQNERLLTLEETKYNLEMRPFVILTDWKVETFSLSALLSNLSQARLTHCYLVVGEIQKANLQVFVTFTNTTQSFLTVQYDKSEYIQNRTCTEWGRACISTLNSKLAIQPNGNADICFLGTRETLYETFNKGTIKMSLILENRIGNKYIEEFDFCGQVLDERDIFGNVHIHFKAENYIVRVPDKNELINVTKKEVSLNGQAENADAELG